MTIVRLSLKIIVFDVVSYNQKIQLQITSKFSFKLLASST